MHVLQAMLTMVVYWLSWTRYTSRAQEMHARASPFPFSAAVTCILPKLLFGQRRAFVAHGGPKPGLARSNDLIVTVQQPDCYPSSFAAASYGTRRSCTDCIKSESAAHPWNLPRFGQSARGFRQLRVVTKNPGSNSEARSYIIQYIPRERQPRIPHSVISPQVLRSTRCCQALL